MRHYRMTRGDRSMTILAMAHRQGAVSKEEEEEVVVGTEATITSDSTSNPLTLMTFSKTSATTTSTTNTTFTPRIKPTKRDTLTATSRPTRRP